MLKLSEIEGSNLPVMKFQYDSYDSSGYDQPRRRKKGMSTTAKVAGGGLAIGGLIAGRGRIKGAYQAGSKALQKAGGLKKWGQSKIEGIKGMFKPKVDTPKVPSGPTTSKEYRQSVVKGKKSAARKEAKAIKKQKITDIKRDEELKRQVAEGMRQKRDILPGRKRKKGYKELVKRVGEKRKKVVGPQAALPLQEMALRMIAFGEYYLNNR